MAKETINTETTGLGITMGSAQEIDVSGGTGDIIDPRKLSESISEAATDELSDISLEGDDAPDSIEPEGLEIVDETKLDKELEKEDDIDTNTPPSDKEEKKPETKAPEEDGEVETFKVLGEHLHSQGILDGYDEEMENTPEAFQEMVQETVKKGIEEYKSSFNNPLSAQFLEYLENDGDPGRFMQMVSGPNYNEISEEALSENENMQKQILRTYYTAQGDTPEDIEDTIQAFENAGNLDKKSNAALTKLQAQQDAAYKQEMTQQKAIKQQQAEQINSYIENLKTDIDDREDLGGFPLNKRTKSEFFDYITKADPKTGKTKLLMDSQDPEKQLLMSFFYFNDFKFDKLDKRQKSKATASLMEKLGRHTDTSKKQKSSKQTPTPKGGDVPNLAVMKKLFG